MAAFIVLSASLSGCQGPLAGGAEDASSVEVTRLESDLTEMKRKIALLEEERRQLVTELERRAESCSQPAVPAVEQGSSEEKPAITGSVAEQATLDSLPVVRLEDASGSVTDEQAGLSSEVSGLESPLSEVGAKTAPAAPVLLSGGADADLFDQGSAALTRGDHYQAEGLFTRFIKANPRHPFADDALVLRGEARRRSRRLQSAETDFNSALLRYPDEVWAPDALLGLGRVRHDLGDQGGARQAFATLLTKFPQSVAAMDVPQEYRP